jgi:hypothetical protein
MMMFVASAPLVFIDVATWPEVKNVDQAHSRVNLVHDAVLAKTVSMEAKELGVFQMS